MSAALADPEPALWTPRKRDSREVVLSLERFINGGRQLSPHDRPIVASKVTPGPRL